MTRAYRTPARRRARARAYRRRKREDIDQCKLEVRHVPTADWLVDEGFLKPWDMDDPAKLRDAINRVAASIYEQYVTHFIGRDLNEAERSMVGALKPPAK